MEEGLKQRLVGALVLLMLAIIFLPLVLDGRDEDHDEIVYRAPQEPVIQITHKGRDQVEKRLAQAKAQFVVDRTPALEDEGAADEASTVIAEKPAAKVKHKNIS